MAEPKCNTDEQTFGELTLTSRLGSALNVDEQIDLVALTWLGRGDGDLSDLRQLRAQAARAQPAHRLLPVYEIEKHLLRSGAAK